MRTQKNKNNVPVITDDKLEFINLYLLSYNVPRVAKKCGIAKQTAYQWLKRPEVQKAILDRKDSVAQQCDITVQECMNELAKIAFFDHKSYASDFKFDIEAGEFGCTLEDWRNMDTSALQEVSCKVNAQGIPYIVFKPYDKINALKELMNRLEGTNGDKHLHLHLTPEEMKDKSAQEIASDYQQLLSKVS